MENPPPEPLPYVPEANGHRIAHLFDGYRLTARQSGSQDEERLWLQSRHLVELGVIAQRAAVRKALADGLKLRRL